jgi:(R,R)-butanediol dehydrogenase / meso-butanediol dehydrogenase / diacetyl reductase
MTTSGRGVFYVGDGRIVVGEAVSEPPGDGEVEVAVAYVGICGTDLHVLHGTMDHRVTLPQLIGHEMSGVVAGVGAGVEGIALGAKVVVRPLVSCGACPACEDGHRHICHRLVFLGIDAPGALQDRWTVPADLIHEVPPAVPLHTAALVEPLAVACHDIRRAELEAGDVVMVFGAGPVGLLIALLARHVGARVMITDVNPARLAVAGGLGLKVVAPEELDGAVAEATGERGADVVFEVSGSAPAIAQATGLLRTRGRLVIVGIHSEPHEVDLFRVFWRELHLLGARVYEPEDFEEAIRLVAAEALPLDQLITSVVPVDRIGEAFDELRSGGKALKILAEVNREL